MDLRYDASVLRAVETLWACADVCSVDSEYLSLEKYRKISSSSAEANGMDVTGVASAAEDEWREAFGTNTEAVWFDDFLGALFALVENYQLETVEDCVDFFVSLARLPPAIFLQATVRGVCNFKRAAPPAHRHLAGNEGADPEEPVVGELTPQDKDEPPRDEVPPDPRHMSSDPTLNHSPFCFRKWEPRAP